MKKKRCFVASLACIMLWQTPVFGAEQEEMTPPEYRCTINNTDEDYESGDWKYGFTVEEEPLFDLKEGEKHVFLLCDGKYVDAPVLIAKDTAYVPLWVLINDMGFELREEGNGLLLVRGNQKLTVSSKDSTLDTSKMLPLRDVSEALGAEVTYMRKGVMPLENPLISVDFRETVLTEEEALEKAKNILISCLKAQEEQGYIHVDTPVNPEITRKIAADIDSLHLSEEVMAGYYLFEGMEYLPYILVEKSTGEMYWKSGFGDAGHGSYAEGIWKIQEGDPELFGSGYYF
ncbi:hypothetical protein [Anaerotignum sp.]|uniref:hypothetical protein n=1 Tax=Anaerotignum sp. TaxID=2039241 RepID=UPI00373664FD